MNRKQKSTLNSVIATIAIILFIIAMWFASDPNNRLTPDDGRWGNDLRSHKYRSITTYDHKGRPYFNTQHSNKCWCIGTEWEKE